MLNCVGDSVEAIDLDVATVLVLDKEEDLK